MATKKNKEMIFLRKNNNIYLIPLLLKRETKSNGK